MHFSFSKLDDAGKLLSMWAPAVTGNYIDDCKKGREYADEVAERMRQGHNPALLGWVVKGFGQDDSRKGVETGFCQRIAEWVLSA